VSTTTAVVFDFDGVLANSEPLHLMACQEVFASIGVELTRDDYFENYLGYDDREMFRRLGERQGLALTDERVRSLIQAKARVFDEIIERTDVLYPEAAACVEVLATLFPLGIASGALRHEIEMILTRARLAHHFRFIVASGDTPNSKPWPDPYVRAAQLHGVAAAQCVAIEDSRWGIESAKAAGLKCVGITTSYPAAQLRGADRVVASLTEFTPALIQAL
jgi:beta-phosphoglucomutase